MEDHDAVIAYCISKGLKVRPITFRFINEGEIEAVPDYLEVALPINEFAALRLSRHTGRLIKASSPALLGLMRKANADAYAIIDHALATESWCSILKSPGTQCPEAMLNKLTHGGYCHVSPEQEAAADAEHVTPDAAGEEMVVA